MFMVDCRSIGWWYWLVTVCLLTAGVAGWPLGFLCAIAVTAFQLAHFIIREGSITAFPVQVRLAYLLLLLIALPEKLHPIYWLPLIGTWVQVLFGYCTMARTVSLLPWNRKEPISSSLLRRTYLSAPVKGNILQGLPPL
jgi:hypothetical protein